MLQTFFLSIVAATVFLFSAAAAADVIYFKSGYSHTGVIIRENEEEITFKTDMGISTISKEKVDFVEKATPEENQKLLKNWRQKDEESKAAAEAQREAEKKFETDQIAKGLIKFEDKWVTPQEKDRILSLRKEAEDDRRKFGQKQREKGLVPFQYLWVTPENAQELRTMEPEIYRLYDDITASKKMIDSLRSAMGNSGSVEEADKYGKRIEEINKKIDESTNRLGELLKRTDEIEAVSVRYIMPEKYREVMPAESDSD